MRIIGEVNGANGYAEPGRDLGPEPPLGASPGCVVWRAFVRDKANCQFCHGIDGDGRGDPRSPGGAAIQGRPRYSGRDAS
jgi:hypothetical protein